MSFAFLGKFVGIDEIEILDIIILKYMHNCLPIYLTYIFLMRYALCQL